MTEDAETNSLKEQEKNNMDWKKNGFDKRERLTLRVNLEEAVRRKSNEKISKQNRTKLRAKPTKNKMLRKQKIRSSIYDDEDEDEEEYILLPVFNNLPKFSLEKALTPKEKLQLDQMEKEPQLQKPEQIQIEQINIQNSPLREHIRTVEEPAPKNKPLKNNKKVEEPITKEDSVIMPEDKTETQKNNKAKDESLVSTIQNIKTLLSSEHNQNSDNEKTTKEDTRNIIMEKSGRAPAQKKQNKEKSSSRQKQEHINKDKENER
ncbi:MAG: hypothetical protein J6Y53_04560 [Alphaproteobacteria bacterium]|nr:hypothetical protein [Alphaproteobacteria bacterium]